MDRDELEVRIEDWRERLQAIAREMRAMIDEQVLGDHGDEQVAEMEAKLDDVVGDLGRLL